jgi:hypothetical protein
MIDDRLREWDGFDKKIVLPRFGVYVVGVTVRFRASARAHVKGAACGYSPLSSMPVQLRPIRLHTHDSSTVRHTYISQRAFDS